MVLCESKDRFLGNQTNKQRFIMLLDNSLQANGFDTRHAVGDADCMIVQTTLDNAQETDTVLVGDDTDLLVLLLYHVKSEHHKVYFKSSSSKTEARIWKIQAVQDSIGADICDNILFVHAIGGCDTTSSVYGLGKTLPFKN